MCVQKNAGPRPSPPPAVSEGPKAAQAAACRHSLVDNMKRKRQVGTGCWWRQHVTPTIRRRARRVPPRRHLLARLLEWRNRRGLATLCALPEQRDAWALRDDNGNNDYDAMGEDAHQNAAYTRAFAAVSPSHKRWLEIGCGSSAVLTRLALDAAPNAHVTAFEVNPKSAEAARQRLASTEDDD